jgi:hypothetical protein
MNTTAVSPAEIDRFLGEQCGWEKCLGRVPCQRPMCEGWRYFTDVPHGLKFPPRYTESLDALFAPGGPVALCRERGWNFVLFDLDVEGEPSASLSHRDRGQSDWTSGDSPALALAEACYKALK